LVASQVKLVQSSAVRLGLLDLL